MVAVALYLKYMFNIPCFFFMHTDWLEYIKSTTNATRHERDRIRRLLRLLYNQFDGIFVLNREHRDWLTGFEMELPEERIFLTAHHAPTVDTRATPVRKADLFEDANDDTPVLFVACRLSAEKGLADLPEILAQARQALPDLRLVIAGSGPAEEELKKLLPDTHFMGWVDKSTLASLYAGLDLFIFPSRFDTFGNVLLEAFAHGMPAIAYNCKGPRDIIEHEKSGYLAADSADMAGKIIGHFSWPNKRAAMRAAALARARQYSPERIMTEYVQNLGLPAPACILEHRSVA